MDVGVKAAEMKQAKLVVGAAAMAALAGLCAPSPSAGAREASRVISGKVSTGNVPIVGAAVTLYGAITQCVPDPCMNVSRAVASTKTDAQGTFAIDLSKASADVLTHVPSNGEGQVRYKSETVHQRPKPGSLYLEARGGDAGAGPNPAIKLEVALGDTTGLHAVTINELTTVVTALVYARAKAETPGMLLNGRSITRALVDPERGTLQPIFTEGANSPALVNTLADVVAGCVRSGGPKSSACNALFAAAGPVDRPRAPIARTSAPADTLAALENIAFSPDRDPGRLFALIPAKPPYAPILMSPPPAFMITLDLARGGIRHPSGIAFDPVSNAVWIANEGGNSVTKLGTGANDFGVPLSGPGGFTGGGLSAPTAIKFIPISPANSGSAAADLPSVWVANRAGDSLTEILVSPNNKTSTRLRRISGNGLKGPVDLLGFLEDSYTGDRANQFVAVANSGADVVSLFKPQDGSPCGKPVEIRGLKRAAAVGQGIGGFSIWVADAASSAIFVIKQPDALCTGSAALGKVSNVGLSAPSFMTYGRQSATAAVTNAGSDSIAVLTYSEMSDPNDPFSVRTLQGSPFRGGGLRGPAGIAIDGDANAWVANNAPGANTISEIGHVTDMLGDKLGTGMPFSPKGGFTGAGLNRPLAITIDSGGNVWVTNHGGNSVTVFVGVARAPF
jgi:DNA-binding beta-propeller fold protein YncE